MIIFDKAYNHCAQFAKWTRQDIFFVCRLKNNAVYQIEEVLFEQVLDEKEAGVLKEEHIHMQYKPYPNARKKKTLCLRKVTYRDEKGRVYRFITNNFETSNEMVAFIYKKRWSIELVFFMWIPIYGKDHVKFVFGLTGNQVLNRRMKPWLDKALEACRERGEEVRLFRQFYYKVGSWNRLQLVVVKIEMNHRGPSVRFIVANLEHPNSRFIYESLYRGRDAMELYMNLLHALKQTAFKGTA